MTPTEKAKDVVRLIDEYIEWCVERHKVFQHQSTAYLDDINDQRWECRERLETALTEALGAETVTVEVTEVQFDETQLRVLAYLFACGSDYNILDHFDVDIEDTLAALAAAGLVYGDGDSGYALTDAGRALFAKLLRVTEDAE